jgi:hypothetical protein
MSSRRTSEVKELKGLASMTGLLPASGLGEGPHFGCLGQGSSSHSFPSLLLKFLTAALEFLTLVLLKDDSFSLKTVVLQFLTLKAFDKKKATPG